jgi:hypothetical protein
MTDQLRNLLLEKLLDWPFLLFLVAIFLFWRTGPHIIALVQNRKIEVELGGNKLSIGDAVEALDDESRQALDDFRRHQQQIDNLKARLATLEGNAVTRIAAAEAQGSGSTPAAAKDGTARTARKKAADEKPRSVAVLRSLQGVGAVLGSPKGPLNAADRKRVPAERGEAGARRKAASGRDEAFDRMLAAISASRFRWRSIERLAIEAGVSESKAHEILAAHHPHEVVLGKGKSGRAIARLP